MKSSELKAGEAYAVSSRAAYERDLYYQEVILISTEPLTTTGPWNRDTITVLGEDGAEHKVKAAKWRGGTKYYAVQTVGYESRFLVPANQFLGPLAVIVADKAQRRALQDKAHADRKAAENARWNRLRAALPGSMDVRHMTDRQLVEELLARVEQLESERP